MREPLVDDDAALETSREKYGDVAGATAVAGEVYYPVNAVVGQRRGKHGDEMQPEMRTGHGKVTVRANEVTSMLNLNVA